MIVCIYFIIFLYVCSGASAGRVSADSGSATDRRDAEEDRTESAASPVVMRRHLKWTVTGLQCSNDMNSYWATMLRYMERSCDVFKCTGKTLWKCWIYRYIHCIWVVMYIKQRLRQSTYQVLLWYTCMYMYQGFKFQWRSCGRSVRVLQKWNRDSTLPWIAIKPFHYLYKI